MVKFSKYASLVSTLGLINEVEGLTQFAEPMAWNPAPTGTAPTSTNPGSNDGIDAGCARCIRSGFVYASKFFWETKASTLLRSENLCC